MHLTEWLTDWVTGGLTARQKFIKLINGNFLKCTFGWYHVAIGIRPAAPSLRRSPLAAVRSSGRPNLKTYLHSVDALKPVGSHFKLPLWPNRPLPRFKFNPIQSWLATNMRILRASVEQWATAGHHRLDYYHHPHPHHHHHQQQHRQCRLLQGPPAETSPCQPSQAQQKWTKLKPQTEPRDAFDLKPAKWQSAWAGQGRGGTIREGASWPGGQRVRCRHGKCLNFWSRVRFTGLPYLTCFVACFLVVGKRVPGRTQYLHWMVSFPQ